MTEFRVKVIPLRHRKSGLPLPRILPDLSQRITLDGIPGQYHPFFTFCLAEIETIYECKRKSVNAYNGLIEKAHALKVETLKELEEAQKVMQRRVLEMLDMIRAGRQAYPRVEDLVKENFSFEQIKSQCKLIRTTEEVAYVMEVLPMAFSVSVNTAFFQTNPSEQATGTTSLLHFPSTGTSFTLPDCTSVHQDFPIKLSLFKQLAQLSADSLLALSPVFGKETLILDSHTFDLVSELETGLRRRYPGVAVLQERVYLFGGEDNGSSLRSVEVLDIVTRRWSFLPLMDTAKSQFQPCVFKHLVYLFQSGQSETFDTETYRYSVLSLFPKFPIGPVVSYSYQDRILILSNSSISVWLPNVMQVPSIALDPSFQILPIASPAHVDDTVFFFSQQFSKVWICSFDLKTCVFATHIEVSDKR